MSNPQSSTIVFTACSVNYLPKAMAMGRSVLAHDPGCDVAILVVDRRCPVEVEDDRITLIWAQDTSFPDYLRAAFKYNIIELNTALKPHVAAMLLDRYEKVVYLDPDVYVFNSLAPLFDDLDHYDLLLSPHALAPYTDDHRPNAVDLLRFGVYNLGFFGVRRSPGARPLLDWWDQCCQTDCWYEPSMGLGVDQKWMDLAPALFNNVHIVKHPGVNVAFWNLHERTIGRNADGTWTVNNDHPLIFVHFSSFDDHDQTAIAGKQTRFAPGSRADFSMARDIYAQALAGSARSIRTSSSEYGYNRMSDGRMISPALRRFFAAQLDTQFHDVVDPFDAAGPVYAFARRHRLFSSRERPDKHVDFKAEKQFGRQKAVLDMGFRLALKFLGPDRYFMLMRYLAHYSSILKQNDLLR
ncbi:putative nucleotide-diphospho-sugar transferase [Sphingomonas sp. BT-65]|uniref:putative nucleotide-diphospho-sugar transferase n=1 Tax=Sphingomonas sp. BT-65 TaxID=2989821 RepID=UPI002235A61A|nr:putative nucleotide-diphospho-sugar transferase [Sphingomonas sp. BT-65]MCW4461888.1 putative nucleotide-diphospho-sugar transferase [Sphingomonas sp. BT-65]